MEGWVEKIFLPFFDRPAELIEYIEIMQTIMPILSSMRSSGQNAHDPLALIGRVKPDIK
jgi:hypothetical protein